MKVSIYELTTEYIRINLVKKEGPRREKKTIPAWELIAKHAYLKSWVILREHRPVDKAGREEHCSAPLWEKM